MWSQIILIKSTDLFLILVFVSVVLKIIGDIKLYIEPYTVSVSKVFGKNNIATSTANKYNVILFSSKQVLSKIKHDYKN